MLLGYVSVSFTFSASSASNRSGRSRPPAKRRGSSSTTTTTASGPKGEASARSRRPRRTTSQRQEAVDEFDPKKLTAAQNSRENNAKKLDLFAPNHLQDPSSLRLRSESSVVQINSDANVHITPELQGEGEEGINEILDCKGREINHDHFERFSLDDLFPNLDFSRHFFTNGDFRQAIRVAMREDIFYTTPAYMDLSPKVAAMMLDDDSSLQGTWNCIPKTIPEGMAAEDLPKRMTRLTNVLKDTLGDNAPTGDEFMMKIGGLCGVNPSLHWIDIIGVKDRVVSHSWHQDTGISYDLDDRGEDASDDRRSTSRYTVTLGFPLEDEYVGTGVFSHAIKLEREHLAPQGHNTNEPVLFEGVVDDEYIVRPEFGYQKEILRSRDTDVLHSAPDVVFRRSLMRFM